MPDAEELIRCLESAAYVADKLARQALDRRDLAAKDRWSETQRMIGVAVDQARLARWHDDG